MMEGKGEWLAGVTAGHQCCWPESHWVTAGHHLVKDATNLHLGCWLGMVTVGHQIGGQPRRIGYPGSLQVT